MVDALRIVQSFKISAHAAVSHLLRSHKSAAMACTDTTGIYDMCISIDDMCTPLVASAKILQTYQTQSAMRQLATLT